MGSPLRVAVLMGGRSSEREVSLASGRRVAEAAAELGHQVSAIDIGHLALPGTGPVAALSHDTPAEPPTLPAEAPQAASQLRRLLPGEVDLVFIALHGPGGEDGCVQGLLELLGILYTGSGVLASALAMNKVMSKRIFRQQGLLTADWVSFSTDGGRADVGSMASVAAGQIGVPAIVKPACQGSTIGVTWVNDPDEFAPALEEAFRYGGEALVERLIEGTEVAGGVLGNHNPMVLPLVEIIPAGGRYDYQAKYTPGATEEIVPARIADLAGEEARRAALSAHQVLGCRGMSRADMMVADDGVYLLEVNTIPGMTSTSLLPRAAEAAGIPFTGLVSRLLELALEDEP